MKITRNRAEWNAPIPSHTARINENEKPTLYLTGRVSCALSFSPFLSNALFLLSSCPEDRILLRSSIDRTSVFHSAQTEFVGLPFARLRGLLPTISNKRQSDASMRYCALYIDTNSPSPPPHWGSFNHVRESGINFFYFVFSVPCFVSKLSLEISGESIIA